MKDVKEILIKTIKDLSERSIKTEKAIDTMHHTQAIDNLVHALLILKEIEKPINHSSRTESWETPDA